MAASCGTLSARVPGAAGSRVMLVTLVTCGCAASHVLNASTRARLSGVRMLEPSGDCATT